MDATCEEEEVQIQDSLLPNPPDSSLAHSTAPNSARRTHILFFIDQLCEMGGAERVLLNMIRLLPKDRFRCTLVTFKIEPSLGIFEDFPCSLAVFPLQRSYGWHAFKVAVWLRNFIRTQSVDIVHTFFETSDIFGGLIARLSGVPVLISSRRDLGILRTWKHRIAYRLVSSMYDRVLAVSEQVRDFCIRQDRLDPHKVSTLYNGIEIDKATVDTDCSLLRASMGLSGASHLISTVAHIRRVKGLDIFIRAAGRVHQEFPGAMFLVLGDVHDPAHYQELRDLTSSLGLVNTVKFLGPSDNVFPLLKMCDIFCLPSRSEGFSNALVEAMACSLPCVATRVGGNSEAIDAGSTGYLVESENPDAIADCILTLLRHPERARAMGREGRRQIELKFTSQAMISQLVGIYDALLEAKRRE
jgi:L-malate glycosyltransferase